MNKLNLREIALQTAIDEYFTVSPTTKEWDSTEEEELVSKIKNDYTVWEPFENYPVSNVVGQVETLARSVESALKYVSGPESQTSSEMELSIPKIHFEYEDGTTQSYTIGTRTPSLHNRTGRRAIGFELDITVEEYANWIEIQECNIDPTSQHYKENK